MRMPIAYILSAALASSALAGCKRSEVHLSPMFNVCMVVPKGEIEYKFDDTPPVDFDEGTLTYEGQTHNVYVGNNPDFPIEKTPSNAEFEYLGHINNDEAIKYLFGRQKSGGEHFDVYVMLSSDPDTHSPPDFPEVLKLVNCSD